VGLCDALLVAPDFDQSVHDDQAFSLCDEEDAFLFDVFEAADGQ
jgi:hypothetical protein